MAHRDAESAANLSKPRDKTVKRLFAVAGNRCAFPKCQNPIVDAESGSIVIEICHIKGEKITSARHDESQTPEERHGFENLILLCGTHHKVIDDDEDTYTVERLLAMKAKHEAKHQGEPEPSDVVVARLIEHMNRIWSGGVAIADRNSTFLGRLRERNLADPHDPQFTSTKYSTKMGESDSQQTFRPWPNKGVFAAVFPGRYAIAANENEFIRFVFENQRSYELAPGLSFLPPMSHKIGKANVWIDGHNWRFVSPTASYLRYLAFELDGYIEYGFYLGASWESIYDVVYYAKLVAHVAAFVKLVTLACSPSQIDCGGVSLAFAFQGIQGTKLFCVTDRVLAHHQSFVPPTVNSLLHLHIPKEGKPFDVDEISREVAEAVIDCWLFSVPPGFGIPEFAGEKYDGEVFRRHFNSAL